MTTGFFKHSGAQTYRLNRATVPAALVASPTLAGDIDGLAEVDILVSDGKIARVTPAGHAPDVGVPVVDLDRGLVLPAFVDGHTHLDKGHIWPRRRNPDGTFTGALENVRADAAANWHAEDVRRRMDFSLRTAYAHGTKAMRTHIDSGAPQHRISWPVLKAMKDIWAGRIDLQASCLVAVDAMLDEAYTGDLLAHLKAAGGVLGAVTYPMPTLLPALDRMFRLATEHGLDLDFHADETGDATVATLRAIAETALAHRFEGRILVGHCCSLARQDESEADRTLDLVAQAGMAIVSLPMCNMYLQDRVDSRTPRWRGVTLVHEMRARGISVSVASDNTRDPFYAYGDLDMVEVFREAVRILHLDHPFADWPKAIAATPASVLGLSDCGWIKDGAPADLVLFRARSWTEFLSRPQADRTVLRAGAPINRTLPDYRELDDLVHA